MNNFQKILIITFLPLLVLKVNAQELTWDNSQKVITQKFQGKFQDNFSEEDWKDIKNFQSQVKDIDVMPLELKELRKTLKQVQNFHGPFLQKDFWSQILQETGFEKKIITQIKAKASPQILYPETIEVISSPWMTTLNIIHPGKKMPMASLFFRVKNNYRSCKIESIATQPGYRGFGYGERLLKRALEAMEPCQEIRLTTFPDNGDHQRLIKYYSKFGFEVVEEPDPLDKSVTMVRYKKAVSSCPPHLP